MIERVAGVEIERLGRKSMLIADVARPEEAWYSLQATLRWLLERQRVTHVLDVGANTGQFGKFVRALYTGKISSFEPVTAAFDKLQQAARDDPNWQAYKFALGSKADVAIINVAPRSNFSSFLQTNEYCAAQFGDRAAGTSAESVTVQRLEQALGESIPHNSDERIYLKMDTQGFDLEVFKGLGDKLPHVVGLQSEVSLIPIYKDMPHWTESVAAFEQAGFGIVGMFPVNRDKGRVIEYDCVLTRI
jgi:FkbM family methyltransferase